QKSKFPNSILKVVQVGAVTVRQGGRDFAIVGLNVKHAHPVDPAALATEALPGSLLNLHTVIDQQFASDALAAVISSGDLAAFINRVLERHSAPVRLAEVRVDDGRIEFQAGQLHVALDCVVEDACEFGRTWASPRRSTALRLSRTAA